MSFRERTTNEQIMVSAIKRLFWDDPRISVRFIHAAFGQESHIPGEAMDVLRRLHDSVTAYHIRFAPDYFVIDRMSPARMYLLEYKCTRTPLYSTGRIRNIGRSLGRDDLDWSDIGQWELKPFENYRRLASVNVRVAILNYCAYHSRPLLCDFVDVITDFYDEEVRLPTRTGSGTPYANFDLRVIRSLSDFLCQEHNMETELVSSICGSLAEELMRAMPVSHHYSSPLYGRS